MRAGPLWGSPPHSIRQTSHWIKREKRRPHEVTRAAKHRPTPKTQRKGRLVWEETPFLTHPGAGIGWVASRTHQLRGYSRAKLIKEAR